MRQLETYEKINFTAWPGMDNDNGYQEEWKPSLQGRSAGDAGDKKLVKVANLEPMKTCSLTSLFILVVLRWIKSGSRLDEEGI